MTTGLILLVFIAFLVAAVFARVQRRMGLAMTGHAWLVIMAAMVLVGLGLWALSTRP